MIYFDYAATSLKRKEIFREVWEKWELFDGNPESLHRYGRDAKKILEESRRQIAASIHANAKQIVFTSGASESNNSILRMFERQLVLTTKIEHASILNSLEGYQTQPLFLPLSSNGMICLKEIKKMWSDSIRCVSFTLANNELGNIQPLEKIGTFLEDKNCWFHVDAVQAYGHIEIDVQKLHCDSLSLSGHKVGGANGFGVLFVKDGLSPFIYGGDQEKKRRAGTSYTVGAYTMQRAFEAAWKERERILDLKKYFIRRLHEEKISFEINGCLENSVPHILNVYFPFIKSNFLLTYMDMRGICISSGSACSAGSMQPSEKIAYVYSMDRAEHSVRFSFGFSNTQEELEQAIQVLKELYEKRKNERTSHCRD